MFLRHLLAGLAIALPIATLTPSANAVDSLDWQTEQIYSNPGWMLSNASLALSSTGRPSVAFSEATSFGSNQIYAVRTTSGWQTEVFGQSSLTGGNSLSMDLLMSNDDQPSIGFISGVGLEYSYREAGLWHTETVIPHTADSSVGWAAADIGPNDEPVLVATRYSGYQNRNRSIQVARRIGGSWSIEDTGIYADHLKVCVDGNGRITIAYADRKDVKVAMETETGWDIQTVYDEADFFGSFYDLDMELDSNGYPHITFHAEPDGFHYAAFNGTDWDITDLTGNGRDNAIGLDPSDRPVIAQLSKSDDDALDFLWTSDGNWVQQTPLAAGALYNSVVIDDDYNVHAIGTVSRGPLTYYFAADVPEPTVFVLMGLGGLGIAMTRQR